jgi:trk system potassium uptake protein TrkA
LYVVVMGCGRVGASLAGALTRIGHEVAIIDRDESAFQRLGAAFSGRKIVGMGFDRDVLARAGIEGADAFAAVSSGDNSNIISARLARETYGIERVVARIYDAKRAAVYERLGIPTVATVSWTTDRFMQSLIQQTDSTRWRDPSGAVSLAQLTVHEDWFGRTVTELEHATGARVAFLLRYGEGLLPEQKTVVQDGDAVYVAALSGTIGDVSAVAGNPPIES